MHCLAGSHKGFSGRSHLLERWHLLLEEDSLVKSQLMGQRRNLEVSLVQNHQNQNQREDLASLVQNLRHPLEAHPRPPPTECLEPNQVQAHFLPVEVMV